MTHLEISELKKELVEIYNIYLEYPKDRKMRAKAKRIYEAFKNAQLALDQDLSQAVNLLVDIVYDTGKKPSKEIIEKLMKKLAFSL